MEVFPNWKDTEFFNFEKDGEIIQGLKLGLRLMRENLYTECPVEVCFPSNNYNILNIHIILFI